MEISSNKHRFNSCFPTGMGEWVVCVENDINKLSTKGRVKKNKHGKMNDIE